MDNRAVSPAVGKILAAGLAVLYIATATGLLLGGVVPEYRTAAGAELGERVLATAGGTLERAVPDTDARVSARVRADLPATIRDASYALELRRGVLRLDHPEDALDTRTRLSLPSSVAPINSTWRSGEPFVVVVSGPPANRTLALAGGRS
jgi:hypothetical protein